LPSPKEISRLREVFENALASLSVSIRKQALTHISYANEKGDSVSNERLEYLGDAVFHLGAAHTLYEMHPDAVEGELTRMRAELVSGASLSRIALDADLGKHLLLGRGEDASGGRMRPRNLAGTLEAVVGAVYLEKGWGTALELVRALLGPMEFSQAPIDAKTQAQERVQQMPGSTLEYRVVSVEGPDHRPVYTVACIVNGKQVSVGRGHSKKEAQEEAARKFLALDILSDDSGDFPNDEIGK
jgi:ribonuclease-3